MKSTAFDLKYPNDAPDRYSDQSLIFTIPILPAFAVEYSEFSAPDQLNSGRKVFIEGKDYFLEDASLIWRNFENPLFANNPTYRLIIHYHGIRDYSLLFPHFNDEALRQRLGCFYKEAELAFENGAWLSYSLMCGAIYEGLLYGLHGKEKSFWLMIKDAFSKGIIDKETSTIMHTARKLRNLVHENKYKEPYVTRLQAMDMRIVMDKLIKRDWKEL